MTIQPSFPTGQLGGYSDPNNAHIIGKQAESVMIAVAKSVALRWIGRPLLDRRPEISHAVPREKNSSNGSSQIPSAPAGDIVASKYSRIAVMEMSTADVFKRSINKLHVPFCFELQGYGIERCALHLLAHHAGLCRSTFEARVARSARVMFHMREGVVK